MAATHLTLQEAAERLGITPEEFKKRLKTHPAFKTLVPIRDGTNLRFKAAAIDELARELGAGSNPDAPLPSLTDPPPPDSDDFKVPASSSKSDDEPLKFDEGEVFELAADEPKPAPGKPAKGDSDSDVRLDAEKAAGKKGGEESIATEELSIDLGGPGSAIIKGGSSAKLSAPKSSGKLSSDSSKSLAKPGHGDSSEFELSLDADSDDFELKLNTDTSDEVALGEMPKDKDSSSGSGRRGGESGILSRKPADSGISLEKGDKGGKKKDAPLAAEKDSDSDVDFELTLDSAAAVSGTKLGGAKKKKGDDSDSEFELTLDSSGESSLEGAALGDVEESKGDIFETDFEIPPMDESGSEAVALESSDVEVEPSSDEEVALEDGDAGESGSEVVLLEDEESGGDEEAPAARKGKGKAKAKKKAAAEDEEESDVDLAEAGSEEDEGSAAGALKGVKGKRRGEEDEDEEEAAVPAGAYRPVPWGPVPALLLLPALVFVLIGGLMGFELLQTMMGYQQPRKPAAPLVRAIATNLDMELKDQ